LPVAVTTLHYYGLAFNTYLLPAACYELPRRSVYPYHLRFTTCRINHRFCYPPPAGSRFCRYRHRACVYYGCVQHYARWFPACGCPSALPGGYACPAYGPPAWITAVRLPANALCHLPHCCCLRAALFHPLRITHLPLPAVATTLLYLLGLNILTHTYPHLAVYSYRAYHPYLDLPFWHCSVACRLGTFTHTVTAFCADCCTTRVHLLRLPRLLCSCRWAGARYLQWLPACDCCLLPLVCVRCRHHPTIPLLWVIGFPFLAANCGLFYVLNCRFPLLLPYLLPFWADHVPTRLTTIPEFWCVFVFFASCAAHAVLPLGWTLRAYAPLRGRTRIIQPAWFCHNITLWTAYTRDSQCGLPLANPPRPPTPPDTAVQNACPVPRRFITPVPLRLYPFSSVLRR